MAKYLRATCLLNPIEDKEIIEMLENDRRSTSGYIRDLLYQELERKNGEVIVINTSTFSAINNNTPIAPSPTLPKQEVVEDDEASETKEDKLIAPKLANGLLSNLNINPEDFQD